MRAKRALTVAAGVCLTFCAVLVTAPTVAGESEIDIPYTKFVLDNGLRLIVHEDPKAPIVAVNVWYHVGSKNEKPGKTGFAHLFEHLMFNGSENYNDDYFKPFDRIGATDMNGTTNFDRTNYFQNVPTSALDVALWMESDRMGHLLGAIDQARLDEQRGVVQNEKRQGENQPYGKAFRLIVENTYPEGHPYSWSVIGSMADLDAATLDDVHEWFETYYGAANAVLSVAGDVKADEVRQKVERYFGDIPSGPPVVRQRAWVAKRESDHRLVLEDRVPQGRIYKAWNIPEWKAPDTDYLDLVSDVLTSGKTSRLHKRLVYDEQLATDVRGYAYARELGSLFIVSATAQPGQDLAEIERLLDEEMARLITDGPTPEELERVKTQNRAAFIRGIERIGGFGGKSDILASSEVYGGDPGYYKVRLERDANATADDLRGAAERWLSSGALVLEVRPFPEYGTVASDVDRSALPEPGPWPEVRFPKLERATLSNGLEIILARRDAVPVVSFDLLVDAGYAADQFGKPGTGSLALDMLDEGTGKLSSLEISDRLASLGARLRTASDLDTSTVRLSALKENLDASLAIFADVILDPAFSEDEFARQKKQRLASIRREKTSPRQMGLRVLPRILYSADHAYGMPLTGSGTEESVASLTRDDLREFHETWFAPNNATLVVVGDTTPEEILPKLERLLKGWKSKDVPAKKIGTAEHQPSAVYLIDRPDSLQSVIFAGHVAPPKANPDEIAIEAMNEVLGGSFTARINMNLREDKHWSYGARSQLFSARGQRPFFVRAPVQSDKTMEAMREIRMELTGICESAPPSDEEVARAKDKHTLTLPGRWETGAAVARSIAEIVRFGLPDDYWAAYAGKVRGLSRDGVAAAAKQVVRPDNLVWVVVGDRSTIEPGIRELGLGELHVIDADGNPTGGTTGGAQAD
jgi:zinc protease